MTCQSPLRSGFEQKQERNFNLSTYLSISGILGKQKYAAEQTKSCANTDNVVLKRGGGIARSLSNACHNKSLMGSICEGFSQSAV